jgi:hypothetical protein
MAEKIVERLYGGSVAVEFLPDSHRYRLEGSREYLPSVTSCTGILDKSRFLIPWAVGLAEKHVRAFLESNTGPFAREEIVPILEEAVRQHQLKKEDAASVGGSVHAYAEAFALAVISRSEVPQIPEEADERVRAGVNAFLSWFVSNDVKFVHAEKLVYSQSHGFAGLIDAVADVNGKRMLIDYKTSKGVYTEMRYQIAGYRIAFEEEHGEHNEVEAEYSVICKKAPSTLEVTVGVKFPKIKNLQVQVLKDEGQNSLDLKDAKGTVKL